MITFTKAEVYRAIMTTRMGVLGILRKHFGPSTLEREVTTDLALKILKSVGSITQMTTDTVRALDEGIKDLTSNDYDMPAFDTFSSAEVQAAFDAAELIYRKEERRYGSTHIEMNHIILTKIVGEALSAIERRRSPKKQITQLEKMHLLATEVYRENAEGTYTIDGAVLKRSIRAVLVECGVDPDEAVDE